MSKRYRLTEVGFVIALIALASGCSGTVASKQSANSSQPIPSPSPSPTLDRTDTRLQSQLQEIAEAARGRVGISALLIETGQTVSLHPQDPFPMQSVYKLPISMAVVQLVDQGKISLDQKVKVTREEFIGRNSHSPLRDKYPDGVELTINDLLRYAIVESDGTASDMLMKVAGGAEEIQRYLNSLQISDMKILDTEKGLSQDRTLQHRNTSTPEAAVVLLRALHEKRSLADSSQALLLKYMIESVPGKKRLKGDLPPGTIVAHKTGTSGTFDGITAATNDIGIITLPNGNHIAIAVFVAASPADEATRERVIAKMANAVWDAWQ